MRERKEMFGKNKRNLTEIITEMEETYEVEKVHTDYNDAGR